MAAHNERHERLLRAIEAGDAEEGAQERRQCAVHDEDRMGGGWWDHLLVHFFGGDVDVLFNDLRINRRVFGMVVSAVDDIALARRGRRGFVFSHQE